jgi:AmmeMemoRadiSam system protein B
MPTVRPPAVAGQFYPRDRRDLEAAVERHVAQAAEKRSRDATAVDTGASSPAPRVLVAPHAGYPYSGPIAGSAFGLLSGTGAGPDIGRVVVIGPSHYVPFSGLALAGADAFETPLGRVPVDRGVEARLAALSQVATLPRVHEPEHSLEVELPFLQRVLGSFALVPLLVGDATSAEVAEVLDVVTEEAGTLLVVSSDLSHFLDYESARRVDRATADAIARGQPVGAGQACGWVALNGLACWLRERGADPPRVLDLRSSGDTAGPRSSVVGYGAFVAG